MEAIFFAEFNGLIVTANADGSIPLNAKIVAQYGVNDDGILHRKMIEQANAYARGMSEEPEK